jgi:hypothetical protein
MVAEQREKLKMLINLLSAYYIRAGQVMKHNSWGTEWCGPVPDRVCKRCGCKEERGGKRKKRGWEIKRDG